MIILSELTRDCFSAINQILTTEKVASDFYSYFKLNHGETMVISAVDDNGGAKEVMISAEDLITVVKRRLTWGDSRVGLIPLVIHIGIGRIEFEFGSFDVEKCTADLLYNHELDLVDVDFFYYKEFLL
ncbi:hypothetical protein SAMN04488109_1799 [Chryseolinea serpens]|uniref:Uncharacterized protein n=1 Tax=Chryseolinea serpens TaxID=947013 RepID=A0A1M5MMF6_9BACT|nr:hypothetical protein [Chryseolinea serpens]SHG77963.1 hypothetical protein SAMN04488109_1799 [Chryseolinea serpens]